MKIVQNLLRHEFFSKFPPKALSRDFFKDKEEHFEGLSVESGAATITEFIAEGIFTAVRKFLPSVPAQTIICGGGAKNPTLVRVLKQKLKQIGVEAEAFCETCSISDAAAIAFLAARCYYHLPITFPETTGVSALMTGGKIYQEKNL